jgi:hypothetical protein
MVAIHGSDLLNIPNSGCVINVISDPLPNLINCIGFSHHYTAINLGALALSERFIQTRAAQDDQTTFYVRFNVVKVLATRDASVFMQIPNNDHEQLFSAFSH